MKYRLNYISPFTSVRFRSLIAASGDPIEVTMTREISPQEKLHWGATSCYLTHGADLVIIRKTLDILLSKLALDNEEHWDVPCLSNT